MASEYLASLGLCVIDADVISRDLTAQNGEALPLIRERFGDGVFHADGTLDRKMLGSVVFSDVACRHALEGIMHPMIQRRMLREIAGAAEAGERVVMLSVPLLFETGMDALCDEVWVTAVEPEQQLKRLMARDQLTEQEARSRIQCQMPQEEKLRRADLTVRTNRSIEQTQQELQGLLKDLKRKFT